jgi:hypothetical protein
MESICKMRLIYDMMYIVMNLELDEENNFDGKCL